MGYDERIRLADERVLETRLGAPLPGLYERAAVLSSGTAPTSMTDETVRYHEVAPSLAGLLAEVLTT